MSEAAKYGVLFWIGVLLFVHLTNKDMKPRNGPTQAKILEWCLKSRALDHPRCLELDDIEDERPKNSRAGY